MDSPLSRYCIEPKIQCIEFRGLNWVDLSLNPARFVTSTRGTCLMRRIKAGRQKFSIHLGGILPCHNSLVKLRCYQVFCRRHSFLMVLGDLNLYIVYLCIKYVLELFKYFRQYNVLMCLFDCFAFIWFAKYLHILSNIVFWHIFTWIYLAKLQHVTNRVVSLISHLSSFHYTQGVIILAIWIGHLVSLLNFRKKFECLYWFVRSLHVCVCACLSPRLWTHLSTDLDETWHKARWWCREGAKS
jgi:hypothetical protein